MSKKKAKLIIYVYGFDRAGFALPSTDHETETFVIKFLGYDTDKSLAEADGIILPSGIFETFSREDSAYGYSQPGVAYDKRLLAEREKQLLNAYKAGTWTVFALGAVNNGLGLVWENTDLAKKILNVFATDVTAHDPNPYVTCKSDEFRKYLDRFGVAQTNFRIKDDKSSCRVLADLSDTPVAIEVRGEFFFVPFFSTKRERAALVEVASELVSAVLEYKRKNDFYLPTWLSAVEFNSETRIKEEIQNLENQLLLLNEEQKKLEKFKGILCTSGRILNEIVVEVLRDYFALNLRSEEKYIEDAVIYGSTDQPIFIVEIKGVNGGLKREHVNQVDSHRERLNLAPAIPGLLILNDFMDLENIDQRKAKSFDESQVAHAQNNNIKILRTTILFELMLASEATSDRKKMFLETCSQNSALIEVAKR